MTEWVITMRNWGPKNEATRESTVKCKACGKEWRSGCKYVDDLLDEKPDTPTGNWTGPAEKVRIETKVDDSHREIGELLAVVALNPRLASMEVQRD